MLKLRSVYHVSGTDSNFVIVLMLSCLVLTGVFLCIDKKSAIANSQ